MGDFCWIKPRGQISVSSVDRTLRKGGHSLPGHRSGVRAAAADGRRVASPSHRDRRDQGGTPMTTFPVGEQTHQAVLPQRPAPESVEADTPGSRDETAHGLPATARGTGGEHGRGETDGRGTRARRRHAKSAASAAKAAENRSGDAPAHHQSYTGGVGVSRVFVLARDGRPLMPCHPARARELLGKGRAVVARQVPFTIRLKDRALPDSEVDGSAVTHRPRLERHRPRPHRREAGSRRARHRRHCQTRADRDRTPASRRSDPPVHAATRRLPAQTPLGQLPLPGAPFGQPSSSRRMASTLPAPSGRHHPLPGDPPVPLRPRHRSPRRARRLRHS